ncbi:ArsR/SmtB family transcription factor [Albimonas pacifica]|uniref:Transcriptional regulator, ArsR family n=1 Tax=Albimonas pacifica TaxID=1114924 RepID=A0A1I3D8T7_9RHOB|nr:winged helix-turn-helix domain-containing protein [Albimonas pacifica]SFH83019.1 transcriptional regulator, ArsR family [Albimonas pacifica]
MQAHTSRATRREPDTQDADEAGPKPDRATAELVEALKALASDKRLAVLGWLRDPVKHFPPQRDGDLVRDGVCAVFLADKLGVSQPTLHRHMQQLISAGLVVAKRTRQWTFYRRDERRIAAVAARIGQVV